MDLAPLLHPPNHPPPPSGEHSGLAASRSPVLKSARAAAEKGMRDPVLILVFPPSSAGVCVTISLSVFTSPFDNLLLASSRAAATSSSISLAQYTLLKQQNSDLLLLTPN